MPESGQDAMIRMRKPVPAPFMIGGFRVPYDAERTHIQVPGSTGGGKSQVIASLLTALCLRRTLGHRAVVFDPGAQFLQHFFCDGRNPNFPRDALINPFDGRSVKWSPLAEIRDGIMRGPDAARIAASIIPPRGGGGESDEWRGHARKLLQAVLHLLHENGATNRELIHLLTRAGCAQDLKALCEDSPASALWTPGNAKMLAGCQALAGEALTAFSYLDPDAGIRSFSIRTWVNGKYQRTHGGWLWATVPNDMGEALQELLRAIAGEVVSAAIARPEGSLPISLVSDEFALISPLHKLNTALTNGRKYNLRCCLGYQDISQLRKAYGDDGMRELLGNLRTAIVMPQSEWDTAEYWSKHLGEVELLVPQSGESEGSNPGGASSGSSTTWVRRTQRAVMAVELMRMRNLNGFVTLPGRMEITRIKSPHITSRSSKVADSIIEATQVGEMTAGTRSTVGNGGLAHRKKKTGGKSSNGRRGRPDLSGFDLSKQRTYEHALSAHQLESSKSDSSTQIDASESRPKKHAFDHGLEP